MSMQMPWYARTVFVAGRPLVLVAALAMSVPGEIQMAQAAGWHGWVAWLMPVCISAYAAAAAVIAEVRRRMALPGRLTATIGAGAALGLALSAQVVAHLIEQSYMHTSAVLVALVSAVPPLVVAHMLHMAATPAGEMTASAQIRQLEELVAAMAGEMADAFEREGNALVSKAHCVKNSYEELAADIERLVAQADAMADEFAGDLAAAKQVEPKPRRQGSARKAIPVKVVKEAVAAMQAEGKKVTGLTLAERLGCSERSGYRYLGEISIA
ncbi:hypothetical protein KQY30_25855 [Streptomyces sp. GMY02]|uniref:hypothetical protein n=1 Tax=Streptomyces sp. GMY02 TaxID=1333528 RepID=UPI001C2CB8AF|nr:hypothetical protein [Streptomyces sp. GMY02]QXE37133.1 hypothetical protein KQY30_25855 [Streptomyces sp. GMY02]